MLTTYEYENMLIFEIRSLLIVNDVVKTGLVDDKLIDPKVYDIKHYIGSIMLLRTTHLSSTGSFNKSATSFVSPAMAFVKIICRQRFLTH